ncbi:nicotinate (nicotinamide) nucleotide adenylyltransferase [uncultured Sphaerochaeta sp.]|uniref:nicotinate (nicotinamide) nucleotide adenylyltransferase n=1 Tax=uncultured Sphaerochaeta sp. TaxID=886478 RepID=UPI002A0A543E|nr:nicotinate (nicotinamide) nucleotide adenylyltransferase [uncultured Sphaerochaeta sp.]
MVSVVPTAMVGGSFDPVHLGHLHLVHTVLNSTNYRRFIFVPVALNNFKRGARLANAEDRLAMLRLGFDAYRRLYPEDPECELLVDDCELKRGGVSYTYDTVKHLYLQYSIKGRLGFVMGDDLLPGLHKWHEFDALKELVSFVVIRRDASAPEFKDSSLDLEFVDNAVYDDSSSEIRMACANLSGDELLGEEIRSLMCEEVADYVQQNKLYRS